GAGRDAPGYCGVRAAAWRGGRAGGDGVVPALDHRLAERGDARSAQGVRPRPAAAAGRPYSSDALPAGYLPLLRFGRHGAEEQLWFHPLPGHLLLPILPAAV